MDVTICVPIEGEQKSRNVPRSVPSGGQIEGQQKDGISQILRTEKMGYPKNSLGDLLPSVSGSVTGTGFQNGNRHFAKRISPIKSYH